MSTSLPSRVCNDEQTNENALDNCKELNAAPAYFDAGQFYWAQARTWLEGLSVHGHGAAIVLPEWRVVDIDTADDWARAEALFQVMARRDTP